MTNKWKDLCVGKVNENSFCLQAKRTRTGKIKFRVAKNHSVGYYGSERIELEDLPSPTLTNKN